MTAWDDLLDEFRSLGGTADNIRLGQGEFGRGLFPVDPAKPVVIDIPDNLLVATADMILVNGVPRVGPNAKTGEQEKAWLDRYQAELAWGNGEAGGIRHMFDMAAALPKDLRHELLTKYQCGAWFQEPTDDLILKCYLESRHIVHRGICVAMPLIELINHGDGAGYEGTDSVRVAGTFPGEIFVQYSDADSHVFFLSWGFAIQRPLAFSVALTGNIQSARLNIGRQYLGPADSERDLIPKIKKNADNVALSFLMIGHRQLPRLPKGIFYRLMRDAGYTGFEESFEIIHHLNRLHFINLLLALDGIDLPIGRILRAMAHYQLRAMSFCFGVREI